MLKSNKLYKFLPLIAAIVWLTYIFIYRIWRDKQLENYRYTVTTTIREFSTLKNGKRIEHTYIVNNKIYTTDYIINTRNKIIVPNGRYLLKYSINHPDISRVIWDEPIPDSLLKVP